MCNWPRNSDHGTSGEWLLPPSPDSSGRRGSRWSRSDRGIALGITDVMRPCVIGREIQTTGHPVSGFYLHPLIVLAAEVLGGVDLIGASPWASLMLCAHV